MLSLIPATEQDFPWLFDLNKATLKDYVEQIWGWDEAWQKDYFLKTFDLDNSRIILVEDEFAGRLTVVDKPDHIFLAYIALLPHFQNRGIGSEVVHSVIKKAEAAGKPLVLTVLNPNPVTSFYERLGFEVTQKDDIRTTMTYGQT